MYHGWSERLPHLQIDRTFLDALLQHTLRLSTPGFECNTAAGMSLSDGRSASPHYR